MSKRLIVTADDMGYNVERNRGIIECFQKGVVTNSSLLVNGVAAEDAAQLAQTYGLPTGLHLNITEGLPVSRGKYLTLTRDDGHFWDMHNLREAVSKGKVNFMEVKEEITAQIAHYEALMGFKPAYVDGHQHAHVIPGVAEIFAESLQEHGILATRLPFELHLEDATWVGEPWKKFFLLVSQEGREARPIFEANNVWASDLFFGLMTMGKNMSVERLQNGLKRAFNSAVPSCPGQPVTCELMAHPGYACVGDGGCGDGADDFSKSTDREYEKSILESETMAKFYEESGITLISYQKCLETLAQH